MTAQIPEYLLYRGNDYSLLTQPLAEWFRSTGQRPDFAPKHTACWRGYVGSWEIRDDRLYLTDLEGRLRSSGEATVKTVFPAEEGPVFAVWFSGELRCPIGDLVEYVHQGYQSRYASELILRVENGVVIGEETRTA